MTNDKTYQSSSYLYSNLSILDVQTLAQSVEQQLRQNFGDAIEIAEIHYDFPVFHIRRDAIYAVLQHMRDDQGYNFLTTLCGIHYPDKKGQELGVVYQLHNMPNNLRVRFKVFMADGDQDIPTVTPLWATANWMERETWDFYGIRFTGHPNLTRLLNMDEMNYHPLRKEHPLEDGSRDDKSDKMFGR